MDEVHGSLKRPGSVAFDTEVEILQETRSDALRRRSNLRPVAASTAPAIALPTQALLAARELSSARPPQKVLVCGDLHGRFDLLNATLAELMLRGEMVDFVLAVGRFLSDVHEPSQMADYIGAKPRRELLVPVYFIESSSKVFIERAAESRKSIQLQPNLIFLGSSGTYDIRGLRISFLSGTYDQDIFSSVWGKGVFSGSHYTKQAVEIVEQQAEALLSGSERVDVLLTSEWPHRCWSPSLKKQVAAMVRQDAASPAVTRLVAKLRPHYHIHAGADRYTCAKVSKGCFGASSTTVALAQARDPQKCDQDPFKRWWRVMSIRPTARLLPRLPVAADAEDACEVLGQPSRPSTSFPSLAEVTDVEPPCQLPPPPLGWKLAYSSTYRRWYYHHLFNGRSSWTPPPTPTMPVELP